LFKKVNVFFMDDNLQDLREQQRMQFGKEPPCTSAELLREVLRSEKQIAPALLEVIVKNFDADANTQRQNATDHCKHHYRSLDRAELCKLIRLGILALFGLGFLYFSNGKVDRNMPLSMAVMSAVSSGMKFWNLPLGNMSKRKLFTLSKKEKAPPTGGADP
jgi:hypothetical protein